MNTKTKRQSLIIVEAKHYANKEEINDKLSQLKFIQKWIDEERKFYDLSRDLDNKHTKIFTIKKDLKALRRKIRRGNANSNTDIIIASKEKELCHLDLEETKLDGELDGAIEINKWHDKFVRTLKSQNLKFDKFILFFGAPLWEKESYKNDLLKNNIGIIEMSGNRYQVKPENVII